MFVCVGRGAKKAGVVPFVHGRGHCIPLWAVFQPLQVVLSSACSVSSLSRFPSHYLPGHPHLREGALAAYLFGLGSPSTWLAGHTAVHDTPSATPPRGAQRGVTLPRCQLLVKLCLRSCSLWVHRAPLSGRSNACKAVNARKIPPPGLEPGSLG